MKRQFLRFTKVLGLVALALVAGCNNDDGGSNAPSTTAITGSVFASQVGGATVTVKDTAGNPVAGPVTTASGGTYRVSIPNSKLSEDLVFESTGGTFTDEATGNAHTAGGALGAYVAGGTLGSGDEVHLTPTSTIVTDLVRTHGQSLTAAENAVASAFGYNVDLAVSPLLDVGTTGATDARLLAGLRAAALSQLALDLGLPAADQFDLFAALAEDLADGSLDGDGSSSPPLPADIRNLYVRALLNFKDSTNNHTGLTADKIGALPFATVALTDSYRVEYVPGMMDATQGKTEFSLHITNDQDQGVTGLDVMLMPVMHMADREHSTPVGGCVPSATAGVYDCTVYYLMSTEMSGVRMGYWDLDVTMDNGSAEESAHFAPTVMMAMGDSVLAQLKGQNDMIADMVTQGATQRTYYLFTDGITGTTGDHTVDLFIAARETMMSHPAVSVGTVLNAGDPDYELTVSTMTVEVSTDPSFGTKVDATDNGNGHWSAAGISGLTDGEPGTLYVRLTVNGEQKTTTGGAPSGSNGYATFLQLTPPSSTMP